LTLENFSATPHAGANTEEALLQRGNDHVKNVPNDLEGPPSGGDSSSDDPERETGTRGASLWILSLIPSQAHKISRQGNEDGVGGEFRKLGKGRFAPIGRARHSPAGAAPDPIKR
jgi:hypothetical protein